jgi:hypothetical protein
MKYFDKKHRPDLVRTVHTFRIPRKLKGIPRKSGIIPRKI